MTLIDDEIPDDIAQIEARIEALAGDIARCDKLALAARLAIGGGAAWLVLALVGIILSPPAATLAAIGGVMGGIVLAGSNASSRAETETALATAEAQRRDLIGRIELRLVGEDHPTLH